MQILLLYLMGLVILFKKVKVLQYLVDFSAFVVTRALSFVMEISSVRHCKLLIILE